MDPGVEWMVPVDYLEPLGDFDHQRNVDESRQEGHADRHMMLVK